MHFYRGLKFLLKLMVQHDKCSLSNKRTGVLNKIQLKPEFCNICTILFIRGEYT